MKRLELESFEVQELTKNEMVAIKGGIWGPIIKWIGSYVGGEVLDATIEDMKEGGMERYGAFLMNGGGSGLAK